MKKTKKEISRLTEALLENMSGCPGRKGYSCPAREFIEKDFIERSVGNVGLLDKSIADMSTVQSIVEFCDGKNDKVVELAEKLKKALQAHRNLLKNHDPS